MLVPAVQQRLFQRQPGWPAAGAGPWAAAAGTGPGATPLWAIPPPLHTHTPPHLECQQPFTNLPPPLWCPQVYQDISIERGQLDHVVTLTLERSLTSVLPRVAPPELTLRLRHTFSVPTHNTVQISYEVRLYLVWSWCVGCVVCGVWVG